ncbi:MAG: histidine phosphatase family protein [Nitrospirae bacterium]|nr:MAG: histidine phosphatase family protein [Nitrospirota bacterium]
MLRTIILVRHAKSKKGPDYPDDFKRPLSSRGKKNAISAGEFLKKQGIMPELIISSDAKRAKKTTKRVISAMGYNGDVVFKRDLYLEGFKAYIDVLKKLDDSIRTVMLVGHNPDLEELVYKITGEEVIIPTAGVVRIEVDLEHWRNIEDVEGELVFLEKPR